MAVSRILLLPAIASVKFLSRFHRCPVLTLTIVLLTGAGLLRAQPYKWEILAGPPGGPGKTDGTGKAARFRSPAGIVSAPDGNLYVADTRNHTIRKVTLAGVVTTHAGKAGQSGRQNGPLATATFTTPRGIAVDAAGALYITELGYDTIRKISPDGMVTTLAGGTGGYQNGNGTAARFDEPLGMAVSPDGTVFVADTANHVIRRITSAGEVSTFCGIAGSPGSVDGTPKEAKFNNPTGVALDSGGNLLVADLVGRCPGGGSHRHRKPDAGDGYGWSTGNDTLPPDQGLAMNSC